MTSRLRYWLPAICTAIVISVFSTHYFSAEQTGRVILPILRHIFPDASVRTLRLMRFGMRKLAHIIEFGVFGVTVITVCGARERVGTCIGRLSLC